jgi:hypothetical protein
MQPAAQQAAEKPTNVSVTVEERPFGATKAIGKTVEERPFRAAKAI